jgi:hypothetical protein
MPSLLLVFDGFTRERQMEDQELSGKKGRTAQKKV